MLTMLQPYLLQVVVTNRNQIALLGDLNSSLKRLRQVFSRRFETQDNRTRALRSSYSALKNRVSFNLSFHGHI